MISKVPTDKQLILFDGVCNLCNSSILYIIKRDKKDKFLFAPLQSEVGIAFINEFNLNTDKTDSILLYQPEERKIYDKSTAALHVARQLNFPTKFMSIFLVVPVFIRNWVYNFVAKNRYKWYGKKDNCMIPTQELKSKFIA